MGARRQTTNCPKKELKGFTLHEDFKISLLKMLKELQEDVESGKESIPSKKET